VDLIRAPRGARWVAAMVLALAPPDATLAGDAGFEEFLHAFRRALAADDRLVIFCAPYGFYFGRTARGWRLIEFMADGED
jgi:hypothetical protein